MTISEVGRQYGLSVDTLRYYERVGLIPPVRRSPSGIRDYSQTDCNWVRFIKCMRGAGLSVESLIEYVALFREGDATIAARKELLFSQREALLERMDEMQAVLSQLNKKIENYEEKIIDCEKTLRDS